MIRRTLAVSAIGVICLLGPKANATITGQLLGTAAPPPTLGGVPIIQFPLDVSPLGSPVTGVATPIGGQVGFSRPIFHVQIGAGWLTWSHGYAGDVYFTGGSSTVMLNLPTGTGAFHFYTNTNEIGSFHPYTVTAVTTSGSMSTLTASIAGFLPGEKQPGMGAQGFGFAAGAGDSLATISISTNDEFGIGEFGIGAVPSPSAAIVLAAACGRRRRRAPSP